MSSDGPSYAELVQACDDCPASDRPSIVRGSSITDYGLLMAGSVLAALPTIAIFLAFQRYFLQGITVGALKG